MTLVSWSAVVVMGVAACLCFLGEEEGGEKSKRNRERERKRNRKRKRKRKRKRGRLHIEGHLLF